MTLVETIVTLALISLVFAITAAMILSGSNFFGHSVQTNIEKYVGDAVYRFIEDRLTYATHVKIADNGTANTYTEAITVEDGKLMYLQSSPSFEDLYGEEFYRGHRIEIHVGTDAEKKQLHVEVLVYFSTETRPTYRTGSTFKLVNMGLDENYIDGDTADKTNPVIMFDSNDLPLGGSLDDAVANEMLHRTYILNSQYKLLLSDYKNAKYNSPEWKAARQRIMNTYGISNTTPTRDNFYTLLLKKYGGAYPLFDKTKLEPLKLVGTKEADSLYSALSNMTTLSVRPYYFTAGGLITDTVFYAVRDSSSNDQWKARLVYHSGQNCWYAYCKPIGNTFDTYPMQNVYQSPDSKDMQKELESGNYWIKLG